MKIGIIGSGRIGGTLGKLWAEAGHHVLFSSRHPRHIRALADEIDHGACSGSVRDAAQFGEVILFAPPFWQTDEALAMAGPLDGKIVIDATNPFRSSSTENGLALPEGTTAVSELVKKIPKAHIVKAFNSVYWRTLADESHLPFEQRYVVCYSGNEEESKRIVASLIEDTGFIAFDLGPLSNAGLQEPGGPFFDREFTLYQADHILHSLGRPMQEAA